MAVKQIKIPKTPISAFNKKRRVSNLLKFQIEHLEAAAYKSAAPQQKRTRPRNEGQAAAYIERLTKQLHPDGARPLVADARPVRPAARRTARPAKKRATARKTTRASRKRKG